MEILKSEQDEKGKTILTTDEQVSADGERSVFVDNNKAEWITKGINTLESISSGEHKNPTILHEIGYKSENPTHGLRTFNLVV